MEYPQLCAAQVFVCNTEQQGSQQIMILKRFVCCSYDFTLIFKPMSMPMSMSIYRVLISGFIQYILYYGDNFK